MPSRHSRRIRAVRDRYGYEVSTTSDRAVEHLDEAVRLAGSLRAGAADAFKASLAEDPGVALAHAGIAFGLQVAGLAAPARQSLETASRLGTTATRRERQHIQVIATVMDGHYAEAADLGREHLAEFPRDVRISAVTNFAINFGGRPDRRAATLALNRSLLAALEGESFFESALGFSCTENDLRDEGRKHAERGLAADPGASTAPTW